MTRYVVDAWGWMEYIQGSELGLKLKPYIENDKSELFTISANFAEVISKFIRRGKNPADAIKIITRLSTIAPVDEELANFAGELHGNLKKTMEDLPLNDAFILAYARKNNIKILTGDFHFKRQKETLFIE